MLNKLQQFFKEYKTAATVTVLACIIIAIQSILLGPQSFGGIDNYTHYNNYVIFKYSFFHLIHNQDIYQVFPADHWDLYKYSPSFSLFFGLFAYLPDVVGLSLWNIFNAAVLLWAIKKLPLLSEPAKTYIAWFVLIELIGSQQNAQSNTIMAGLIIGAFALAEDKKYFWSILLIVFSAFIKIYGLLAISIYLFYPQKLRNILYFIFWNLVFFLLPLAVISPTQLSFLYKSWGKLLADDNAASIGLSIFGWLQIWFHINPPRVWVIGIGLLIYVLPFLKIDVYKNVRFRLWILASTLLWLIIFNHKAESPTFIIAVAGVGIWYYAQAKHTLWTRLLFWGTFIFTCLSPTDIFPNVIQDNFFDPYVIKVVPCIIVWIAVSVQLLIFNDKIKTGITAYN